ncbi:GTPase Obg [Aquisphaera giovannonii]|uniref:GTPase Obg n=1 Tax=Aquisphaera giovannonii TaxID=406548 RepID=A0A5B9W9J2_9BACT|nr:GTPase ObgE [Aquisphaera giovannonii]QEH37196.1 GTPase Obg [Aquisphaera giovannonii]
MFVDRVTLFVKGGDGGNGCLSFRHEKYAPRGGPNGGDGGNGGDVVLRASEGHTNLAHLSHQRHWKASRGEHGQGSNCFGKNGQEMVIEVPPGTIVRDRDRGNVIRDLKKAGESVVVARGGRGGHGNTFFKSSTNRAPRQHEHGFSGEERWITLELKVIADVGLIGLPNAGKSTLLSRISRAHPEIADYPFTTKYPNLGTVVVDDSAFVVADIPGLIEGAHAGLGLGHEFLRHVERSGVLVHLVEAIPTDGSDPVENYRMIRRELLEYSPSLAERPEIVVVTKLDLTDAQAARDRIARELGREVLSISAVTGKGIPVLLRAIQDGLRARAEQESPPAPPAIPAPPPSTPAPAEWPPADQPGLADEGRSSSILNSDTA